MNWKTRMLTMLFLLIPAYAGYTPAIATAAPMAGQQFHDMSFSWNIQQGRDAVTIKGLAKNNFHHKIYQLQLFAVLLDENGKPYGKEAVFLGPTSLALDQSERFTLTLPVTISIKPKNIRLEYRYHLPNFAERYWSWTYGLFRITPEGSSRS